MSWTGSTPRKNTKGQRIAKLKRKIASKKKKLSQANELKSLQKQWDAIRAKS